MAIPFCPGYDREPFATLVANYPGKDLHPVKDFRVEWGPISRADVRRSQDGTATRAQLRFALDRSRSSPRSSFQPARLGCSLARAL
jgi:hypothetical protein